MEALCVGGKDRNHFDTPSTKTKYLLSNIKMSKKLVVVKNLTKFELLLLFKVYRKFVIKVLTFCMPYNISCYLEGGSVIERTFFVFCEREKNLEKSIF